MSPAGDRGAFLHEIGFFGEALDRPRHLIVVKRGKNAPASVEEARARHTSSELPPLAGRSGVSTSESFNHSPYPVEANHVNGRWQVRLELWLSILLFLPSLPETLLQSMVSRYNPT